MSIEPSSSASNDDTPSKGLWLWIVIGAIAGACYVAVKNVLLSASDEVSAPGPIAGAFGGGATGAILWWIRTMRREAAGFWRVVGTAGKVLITAAAVLFLLCVFPYFFHFMVCLIALMGHGLG